MSTPRLFSTQHHRVSRLFVQNLKLESIAEKNHASRGVDKVSNIWHIVSIKTFQKLPQRC